MPPAIVGQLDRGEAAIDNQDQPSLGQRGQPAADGRVKLDEPALPAPSQPQLAERVRSHDRARDDDAEAPGETGQGGDLRNGERAALFAAGARVEAGQRRIGLDEPALSVDAAADDGDARLRPAAHAASTVRSRVESRAMAAR